MSRGWKRRRPEPAAPEAQSQGGAADLPSADALIEDLENFLRGRQESDN